MKSKFRVWDLEQKIMHYEKNLSVNFYQGDIYVEIDTHPDVDIYEMMDFEIMQSTGIKDIDDKEIYEGDIVNIHHFTMGGSYDGAIELDTLYINAIITYNKVEENGLYEWCIKTKDFEFPINSLDGLHEESFHVVGNIYENPELLED